MTNRVLKGVSPRTDGSIGNVLHKTFREPAVTVVNLGSNISPTVGALVTTITSRLCKADMLNVQQMHKCYNATNGSAGFR